MRRSRRYFSPESFDHLSGIASEQALEQEFGDIKGWLCGELVQNLRLAVHLAQQPRAFVPREAAARTIAEDQRLSGDYSAAWEIPHAPQHTNSFGIRIESPHGLGS